MCLLLLRDSGSWENWTKQTLTIHTSTPTTKWHRLIKRYFISLRISNIGNKRSFEIWIEKHFVVFINKTETLKHSLQFSAFGMKFNMNLKNNTFYNVYYICHLFNSNVSY